LLGEYQEDGQPVREYIYLDSVPLALLHYRADSATPTITWYHTDQLGTPQALTNADGNIVWQARYSLFGTAELLVNIVTQPLRFPGQYYDEESGLHYNYFRYYDAALGRYLRSDPIGLRGGVNTYGYVGSHPLSYSDEYGLSRGKNNPWNRHQSTYGGRGLSREKMRSLYWQLQYQRLSGPKHRELHNLLSELPVLGDEIIKNELSGMECDGVSCCIRLLECSCDWRDHVELCSAPSPYPSARRLAEEDPSCYCTFKKYCMRV
jgi:RHS repeat-associated protein